MDKIYLFIHILKNNIKRKPYLLFPFVLVIVCIGTYIGVNLYWFSKSIPNKEVYEHTFTNDISGLREKYKGTEFEARIEECYNLPEETFTNGYVSQYPQAGCFRQLEIDAAEPDFCQFNPWESAYQTCIEDAATRVNDPKVCFMVKSRQMEDKFKVPGRVTFPISVYNYNEYDRCLEYYARATGNPMECFNTIYADGKEQEECQARAYERKEDLKRIEKLTNNE